MLRIKALLKNGESEISLISICTKLSESVLILFWYRGGDVIQRKTKDIQHQRLEADPDGRDLQMIFIDPLLYMTWIIKRLIVLL